MTTPPADDPTPDEELRTTLELALRVPPGEPLPPTITILKAIGPVLDKIIDGASRDAYQAATDRWSDLVAEFRRQIDGMRRREDQRASGVGQLVEAAALVAASSCETFTTGPGSCCRENQGRYAYTTGGGAYRWCLPCVMWAALNDVPLTHEPDQAQCETCGDHCYLRGDGTLYDHRWRPAAARAYVACPGSGKKPPR